MYYIPILPLTCIYLLIGLSLYLLSSFIVWDTILPCNYEPYCIDCRQGVVISSPLSTNSAGSTLLQMPTCTYMTKSTGTSNILYDFSILEGGPGCGVYLVLGSTVNPTLFTQTDSTPLPDTSVIYQINTNTYIYMMVVTSDPDPDPNVGSMNYYNYGVTITPLYGHDSLNFSIKNVPGSNTRISLATLDTQNTYYWWYNKIF